MRSRFITARRACTAAALALFAVGCNDQEPVTAPEPGDPSFARVTGPVVNSLADDGDGTCTTTKCTLRDAIDVADTGGTITFSSKLSGTITVQRALDIDKSLTIVGPGAARVTVLTTYTADDVFDAYGDGTVSISGLTVSGATDVGSAGVNNDGATVTLTGVVLTGNYYGVLNGSGYTTTIIGSTITANVEDGIDNEGGTVTLTQSTVSANGESGIYSNGASAAVTVRGSTIRNNGGYGIEVNGGQALVEQATVSGNGDSGIRCDAGSVQVVRSLITGNSAHGGGGIFVEGADLVVDRSTISGNVSLADPYPHEGGGLYVTSSTVTISNSTISGNTAAGRGGGIYSNGDLTTRTTTIVNSTIAQNQAGVSGGGIYNAWGLTLVLFGTVSGNRAPTGGGITGHHMLLADDSQTHLKGTIVAGNTTDDDPAQPDDVASEADATHGFTSLGYNLIGAAGANVDLSTEFAQTGDQTGVDPKLAALADNGGPTETQALASDSPALNAIPASACTDADGAPVTSDQRGAARPYPSDGECDIGAFELTATPAFSSSCTYSINPRGQVSVTVAWSNATPGVTLIAITSDGARKERRQAPAASGTWSTGFRSGWPTYALSGGTSRTDATTELVAAGRQCLQVN